MIALSAFLGEHFRMVRSTVVVEGPLAFRMRRLLAARQGAAGLQIMTMPLLAARLAGGFARPAQAADIDPAIRAALSSGDLGELAGMRELPGTTRALARTFSKIWRADLSLAGLAVSSPRIAILHRIETDLRAALPAGALTPRALCDAAINRIAHAPAVLGPIELDRVIGIAPVWRRLLQALAKEVELTWRNPGTDEHAWFPGEIIADDTLSSPVMTAVSCADPRAEIIEALRWARELLAGGAKPEEIAICAPSPDLWDEHMLVLSRDAGLPVHFSHGTPALAGRDGQACAALADILLNGLRQHRVRRLLRYASRGDRLKALPPNWAVGLEPSAALSDLDQWRRALEIARVKRTDAAEPAALLMPMLALLSRGIDAAQDAGEFLPTSEALHLWRTALLRAPASALEFCLQELRVPDHRDAGASIAWCPADHLAGAPRACVRLVGLTTRSWPRPSAEDPLLPDHILPRGTLEFDPVTDRDRRIFAVVVRAASAACVISRSRRNTQGGLLAASPLVPEHIPSNSLKRTRIPSHAFSGADRLLARPQEAGSVSEIVAAMGCWKNWRRRAVTSHDGLTRAGHPAVAAAVAQLQSATSLSLMLRDPIAFVWRYALDWRPLADDDEPLSVDARTFGELVHELLRRAVGSLEPEPGFGRAARHEIENALLDAVAATGLAWPIDRAVPPLLLWQHTLAAASDVALKALTFDHALQAGNRSWAEVAFGIPEAGEPPAGLPWRPDATVTIDGTGLRIRGSIDRLDYNPSANGVRLTDYKTGIEPPKATQIVLAGGRELQRVLYALAARQLMPDNPRVIARLIYLSGETPREHRLPDIEAAITQVTAHVNTARELLNRGAILPGTDAREDTNAFRLALPAAGASYFMRKQAALAQSFGEFQRVWSSR